MSISQFLGVLRATVFVSMFANVGFTAPPAVRISSKPLNVVLILADDLGATDLGCFGSRFYETPNIDRLARESMKFRTSYASCTVCSPTRASILTGKYPARLHLTDWILGEERPFERVRIPDWQRFLPPNEVTLAKVLKVAGYATAAIGKWHLGEPYQSTPAQEGFDLTVGGTSSASHLPPYGPGLVNIEGGPKEEFLTDRLTDKAIGFIEQNRDRPFFLYLAHYAPHSPIQGKPEVIEKYRHKDTKGLTQTNPVYAALVESLDDSVGRVLETLHRLRLEDHTLVIFTSDNGGEAERAGKYAPSYVGMSNWPLRLNKGSSYEGGLRVPTLIRCPGVTQPNTISDVPIISVDYFPTVMELAKETVPLGTILDGISLVPLLRGEKSSSRDAIYWHFPHYHSAVDSPYSAVRSGDWKLIHYLDDDHSELYNLGKDVSETNDLLRLA
jgi:arylsulfatase A